ncbi:C6 finger transcription factor fumR [Cladobotryum mycophilum]|uniref:C6 finger transcription factor fumR n=1 Tax=Cladobotryum mycophilum TaxID=491253 RepID=A0ABR0SK39_9HYPO
MRSLPWTEAALPPREQQRRLSALPEGQSKMRLSTHSIPPQRVAIIRLSGSSHEGKAAFYSNIPSKATSNATTSTTTATLTPPPTTVTTPSTEQVAKHASEHFNRWSTSLLHISPELDLDIDHSLQQDLDIDLGQGTIHPADADLHSMLGVLSGHGYGGDNLDHGHRSHSGTMSSQSSTISFSLANTPTTHFSDVIGPHGTHQIPSLVDDGSSESYGMHRNVDADMFGVDMYMDGTVLNFGEDPGYPPKHMASSMGRMGPVCNPRDMMNRARVPGEPSLPSDGDITTWILRLSQLNMELHQHLHSIPPIGLQNLGAERPKDCAIDRTFQLSHQYTEILNRIFPADARSQSEHPVTLDEPFQLLVLSNYLYLVESYDKILQHIKSYAEMRLKTDAATAEAQAPISLPNLNIGSFELPSSTHVVILIHIMETMMARVRDLVNEMVKPPCGSPEETSESGAGAQGVDVDDRLTSITKVSLQAIRVKEKATLKLIGCVRSLAIQCGIV